MQAKFSFIIDNELRPEDTKSSALTPKEFCSVLLLFLQKYKLLKSAFHLEVENIMYEAYILNCSCLQ
jgi:hypothetical protein